MQLEPRPVRQPVGDGWLPALLGNPDPTAQPMLQLSRGGWENPTGLQRPGVAACRLFLREEHSAT